MQKRIQKFIWKLLERELMAVLAVSFLGLAWIFAQANTIETRMSVTIAPAAGLIEVTAPNGGETWLIGTAYNITWDSVGEVDFVKIELQRSVDGAWEEIVDSTTNDSSHPWVATGAATDSAKIRVTEVGDATVTDESDGVFTIAAPTISGGGGGRGTGGGIPTAPMIDLVTPREFSNNSEVTLAIRGSYLEFGSKVYLGTNELVVPMNLGYELRALVPVGFLAGQYQLKVVNPTGTVGVYGTSITVRGDQFEAVVVGQSPSPLTLLPGEKTEVWVRVKNLSNYPWVRSGSHQTQLGVTMDQRSIFYDSSSWLLDYRAARMEESAVGYGEIATFRFLIKAPALSGDYTDQFALVVEHVKWLNMPLISWRVLVKPTVVPPTTGGVESYADRLLKQSPRRIEVAPGQAITLWADFENTGTITWTPDGKHPVRIGTEKPRDRVSRFRGTNWVLKDRPSNVESVTPAGAVGRFTINIKAPTRVGSYREYFGLVAEHKTWINGDLVYWEIVVKKPSKLAAAVKPPTTSGIGISWAPSSQAQLFVDGTEQLFSPIVRGVSNLWSALTKIFSRR